MRKRFLALVMVLVVSSSPGVVHAADRQYINPDPDGCVVHSTLNLGNDDTTSTDKPTDFSGLTISLPVRADLKLNNDETAYAAEDYVEIKGDLDFTKYITATATAEYTSPDGNITKTPKVSYKDTDFKWAACQILEAKRTEDYRAFGVSIPSKEVEGYVGTWDGHIDFTFEVGDMSCKVPNPSLSRYNYLDQRGYVVFLNNVSGSSPFKMSEIMYSVTFNKPVTFIHGEHVSHVAGDGTNTLQYSEYFWAGVTDFVTIDSSYPVVCTVDGSSDLEIISAECFCTNVIKK